MAAKEPVKALVKRLSGTGIIISSDVSDETLGDVDCDLLASMIIEEQSRSAGLKILGNSQIAEVVKKMRADKVPNPIEASQRPDFKAYASEIDARYAVNSTEGDRSGINVEGFVTYFRDRLSRLRDIIGTQRIGMVGLAESIDSLKNYTNGREVTVVGMVSSKIVTKKGNTMVVLDDDTGECKVMFMNGSSQKARELFEKARNIINDEVVAVNGKISGPFLIANEIVWPDIPIKERKRVEEDFAIAFVSDIHVGSKKFMEKNFSNLISWLNGNYGERRDLAGKVKYLVVGGDVVDGIGIYPGQDRELAIPDIYVQYKMFMHMVSAIPDYMHAFIIPGNHDGVQRAEPQPALTPSILGDFKADNMHMVPNPSYLTLHGIDILAYHGTSLDSVIRSIPGLSYAKPDGAMIEVLKRRHLSPIYGGNIIVPSRKDNLVIDKVPDILNMGHVHKNCVENYHGVHILNSGTWQSITDFQLAQGHVPSPCILSVYEAKYDRFTTINFK
jgi:DNA polymerase II small subunit